MPCGVEYPTTASAVAGSSPPASEAGTHTPFGVTSSAGAHKPVGVRMAGGGPQHAGQEQGRAAGHGATPHGFGAGVLLVVGAAAGPGAGPEPGAGAGPGAGPEPGAGAGAGAGAEAGTADGVTVLAWMAMTAVFGVCVGLSLVGDVGAYVGAAVGAYVVSGASGKPVGDAVCASVFWHTSPDSRFVCGSWPELLLFSQHVPLRGLAVPYDQYLHFCVTSHFLQHSAGLDACSPPLMRSAPW